ncbi:MAG: thermonuclease family protein [Theionarchaea archaeon]|nr:thermonuclease family protein [Theionarchaea archaeon]
MEEINVTRGCSPYNNEKHCSDGDSCYLNGEFENVLFRLMGIDAFEICKMNIDNLWNSRFLYRLTKSLRNYLWPKLTEESVNTHKSLGIQATEYLESILEEELNVLFKNQILDRYGRPLCYLLSRNEENYNLRLVQSGWAIPYFIYPNAVSATDEGVWEYDTINLVQDAAIEAREKNLGVWPYIHDVLIPMELRFLIRREPPLKYCADLKNMLLYPPQQYYKVLIEHRLFFYSKDVLTALQKGFNPTPDCDAYLHRVWRVLQK